MRSLPQARTMSSERPRAIVVDDDATFGSLVRRILQNLGYEVDLLTSPFGVSNRVAERKARVVVLDFRMPGLDGASLCKVIRQDTTIEQPRIIICSASATDLPALAALAGADGHFAKAIGPIAISQKLVELIGA